MMQKAAAGLTGLAIAVSLGACGTSAATKAETTKLTAFDICKDFVKDRLKSPSTATFRDFFQDDGEVTVEGAGTGPYNVTSSVDSENSFGAKLRSTFTCNVTNDTGDHWVLNDINIQDGGS